MTNDEALERIVKGAEYIERVGKSHPTYKAALDKYDRLVQEYYTLDGRDVNGLSPLAASH